MTHEQARAIVNRLGYGRITTDLESGEAAVVATLKPSPADRDAGRYDLARLAELEPAPTLLEEVFESGRLVTIRLHWN